MKNKGKISFKKIRKNKITCLDCDYCTKIINKQSEYTIFSIFLCTLAYDSWYHDTKICSEFKPVSFITLMKRKNTDEDIS